MESTYMYIIYIVFEYISVSDPLNFDVDPLPGKVDPDPT